ncbi:acidic phospholipase A2 PA4-like isoform X2 [Hydractinia symbiolongicarpus]|nr:acidic phospholipase A2 PA4-like isoform X2 [Hydractinia symbiolongicarpus]XP_057293480.1 acidic phospholipase A2 PA4-like isoform X2 [Hydractinia symbiolongicarpus]
MIRYLLVVASFLVCCAAKNMFIWQGTRWCGYGSAPSQDGGESNFTITKHVDNCCKEHDQCPYSIPRWKRRYNLLNWRPFTISFCGCDRSFLKCLSNDTSIVSQDIKRIYFDILEVACFDFELRDVKVCVKRTWYLSCEKYAMRTQKVAVISKL